MSARCPIERVSLPARKTPTKLWMRVIVDLSNYRASVAPTRDHALVWPTVWLAFVEQQ